MTTAPSLRPLVIHSDVQWYLLAPDEDSARAYVASDGGIGLVDDIGWMIEDGWDRERYERRRDFRAETGLKSWWTSCLPPADRRARKGVMRAWTIRFI
jgi:hypothetical protein